MEFCYFKLGLAVHQCRLLLLGRGGCWAGEGEFAHADCTSGEWSMEVRVLCLQMFFFFILWAQETCLSWKSAPFMLH